MSRFMVLPVGVIPLRKVLIKSASDHFASSPPGVKLGEGTSALGGLKGIPFSCAPWHSAQT